MSMIYSLFYLTTIRPNITFYVKVFARYQANHKMSHLAQVKRIIRYISGTSDYGLMYFFLYQLIGYYDVDWDGNANNRKKKHF